MEKHFKEIPLVKYCTSNEKAGLRGRVGSNKKDLIQQSKGLRKQLLEALGKGQRAEAWMCA